MRTTLNIDDEILAQAARLTGIRQKTELVRMGLNSLISEFCRQRLSDLGGTDKNARAVPRRRLA